MNPATSLEPVAALALVRGMSLSDFQRQGNAALRDDLVVWRELVDVVFGGYLRALAEFDKRELARDDGLRTVEWLRDRCRLSAGTASGHVRLARRVAADPTGPLASAVTAGHVSYQHASVIGRTLDAIPAPAQAVVEELLVGHATRMDPGDLARAAERITETVVPEIVVADAEDKHLRRHVNASETFEGMVHVEGLLDPDGGAVVLAVLRTLSMPAGPDDLRSSGQRNADALVDVCRHALDSGQLPDDGGVRPHVTLTVDVADLMNRRGFGTLEDGALLPIEAVRRLLCDATLTRLVLNGPSEILDVGHATRIVSAATRRALNHRDKGCVARGCRQPPRWCDAHHIIFWSQGGATCLSNLVLLCRRHHRLVHEGGWRVAASGSSFVLAPPMLTGRAPPAYGAP